MARNTVHILNVNMEKELVILSDLTPCRIYEWLDDQGDYCEKYNAEAVIFVTPWHSIHTAIIRDHIQELH